MARCHTIFIFFCLYQDNPCNISSNSCYAFIVTGITNDNANKVQKACQPDSFMSDSVFAFVFLHSKSELCQRCNAQPRSNKVIR